MKSSTTLKRFLYSIRWSPLVTCILISVCIYKSKSGWEYNERLQIIDTKRGFGVGQQEDWKNVGHSKYEYYVYSAYSFGDEEVTIIGTPNPFGGNSEITQCAFYWSNGKHSESKEKVVKTLANMETMTDWPLPWAGTFVRCQIPQLEKADINKGNPKFISVLLGDQSTTVRLPINYRTLGIDRYPYKFSACVLPLYGYNQVFHYLEWLEFYKLMGVERFTFYNRSIGPATTCVMEHLNRMPGKNHNRVEIHIKPWHNYPQKDDKEIRDGSGLSAGANECLYSHKGITKYMVFVDVDEFIVPMNGIRDYHEMVTLFENLSSKNENGIVGRHGECVS